MPERPIPVAEWTQALICRCSLSGVESSNPAGGMDVFLLSCVLCIWQDYIRLLYTQRVQMPASKPADCKLAMPITRRNEKAWQSGSRALDNHLTSQT